jgi:hypothetical protein
MDPLKCMMMVKSQEAQYAGEELIGMADRQEANLAESKKLRDVQAALDKYSMDGEISQSEYHQMASLMEDAGLEFTLGSTNGGNEVHEGTFEADEIIGLDANEGKGVDDVEATEAQKWFDAQSGKVEDALQGSEDAQAQIGIQMQLSVQDYTDAAGEESSLSKQVSDLRGKISAKLDG